jgi:hypothetical protein
MQKYSISHLIFRFNSRVWGDLLKWLAYDWVTGVETVCHSDGYFQLWSPVQSETEEFPN